MASCSAGNVSTSFASCRFIVDVTIFPIDSLNEAFMIGNDKPLRNPPSLFKTPPYVTARPVVTHRKMSLPAADGSTPSQKAVRFLVLATDGLWDQLRYDFFNPAPL